MSVECRIKCKVRKYQWIVDFIFSWNFPACWIQKHFIFLYIEFYTVSILVCTSQPECIDVFCSRIPFWNSDPILFLLPSPRCLNACTYCKTKHARGDLASYPIEELVERTRQSFQGEYIDSFTYALKPIPLVLMQQWCTAAWGVLWFSTVEILSGIIHISDL